MTDHVRWRNPGICTKQWGGAVCRNCPCDSLARIADELHALGDVANADGTSEAIAGGLCEVAEAIAYAKGKRLLAAANLYTYSAHAPAAPAIQFQGIERKEIRIGQRRR